MKCIPRKRQVIKGRIAAEDQRDFERRGCAKSQGQNGRSVPVSLELEGQKITVGKTCAVACAAVAVRKYSDQKQPGEERI